MVYRALEAPSVQIQVQFIVALVGLVFQKQVSRSEKWKHSFLTW